MDDATPDYEAAADQLFNAFEVHDLLGLARASDEVREEQRQARTALFNYLTGLWEDLKRAGEQPGASQQYASIAVLRNVAGGLVDNTCAALET